MAKARCVPCNANVSAAVEELGDNGGSAIATEAKNSWPTCHMVHVARMGVGFPWNVMHRAIEVSKC